MKMHNSEFLAQVPRQALESKAQSGVPQPNPLSSPWPTGKYHSPVLPFTHRLSLTLPPIERRSVINPSDNPLAIDRCLNRHPKNKLNQIDLQMSVFLENSPIWVQCLSGLDPSKQTSVCCTVFLASLRSMQVDAVSGVCVSYPHAPRQPAVLRLRRTSFIKICYGCFGQQEGRLI
ncbi:hypothetical protein T265_03791 [Opisthorchis viverrini]|uniref:Uncharacterized protein n=1 Tax=Opisthorchis viverrini TaxID=6198 RepID=A0A074ZUR2_OPIVI|nr:hypothetical protein T265_03791 [Opisthorchis viverrini]KER29587.1 hypothetical protein T265_03791 [Opisthorchis viverrini]